MLAPAGIAAFSADAEMIRRRPIQQYHCSLCAGLFPQGERLCGLGGDCANLRPPRADDRRVASNQSSKAPSIGEKLEMLATSHRQLPLMN
jgi:hypothetical protein